MDIIKNLDNNTLSISLIGTLDTNTAPLLEKELQDNLDGVSTLILNFDKLEYLSSAGLRILLATQKTMNKQGKMVIKNVNDTIMEVFEMTGFSDILTIQ